MFCEHDYSNKFQANISYLPLFSYDVEVQHLKYLAV